MNSTDKFDINLCEQKPNTDGIWLQAMLDTPFQGVLAIDAQGNVIYVNSFFLKLLILPKEQVIGHKVWDVVPDCCLYDTVMQGHSHWGEILKINSHELVVARFPLKNEKRIIGAVVKTLFPDRTTAHEVALRLTRPNQCRTVLLRELHTCRNIIGESDKMLLVKKLARRASRTSSNLLITGDSGTGKGIVAEAIHSRSSRSQGPFIRVNCAAIPETLLEAELFGFVEGAFTGATRGGKPGKFELAIGGTIFLDEIGDMPLFMQAKLLQVLQDRQVERIGDTQSILLDDIRVVSATNQDLPQLVKERKFREDLYYRLKVLEIYIPSLCERLEEIPMLVTGLINKINKKLGTDAVGVTAASMDLLQSYQWPGNVRELENLLEQAVNWSDEAVIDITCIPGLPWQTEAVLPTSRKSAANYQSVIEAKERSIIIKALIENKGNKAKTARMLDMQRSVLYKKLKRLKIDDDSLGIWEN